MELTRAQLPRLSLREIPAQSCTAHGICGLPLAQEVSGPEKGRGSDRQQRRAWRPGTDTPCISSPLSMRQMLLARADCGLTPALQVLVDPPSHLLSSAVAERGTWEMSGHPKLTHWQRPG